MPVDEIRYFQAYCDECRWVSLEQESEDEAETLLDKHIREEH